MANFFLKSFPIPLVKVLKDRPDIAAHVHPVVVYLYQTRYPLFSVHHTG